MPRIKPFNGLVALVLLLIFIASIASFFVGDDEQNGQVQQQIPWKPHPNVDQGRLYR